jgi:hypothetical protein
MYAASWGEVARLIVPYQDAEQGFWALGEAVVNAVVMRYPQIFAAMRGRRWSSGGLPMALREAARRHGQCFGVALVVVGERSY